MILQYDSIPMMKSPFLIKVLISTDQRSFISGAKKVSGSNKIFWLGYQIE